jgi:DNA-binding NtrC family response regulator
MTKMMLVRIGCRVTAKTCGSEALKVFTENPDNFNFVVADQAMSDMIGIAFAKDSLAMRKNMPVIICTGDGEIASQESACGVGIRGFVIKPATSEEIPQGIAGRWSRQKT